MRPEHIRPHILLGLIFFQNKFPPARDRENLRPNMWILEPLRSGFQTETWTGFIPVTLNVWHLWRSQNVTILDLWPRSHAVFFSIFLAKQIWLHFGHKCHKWSQIQMWLVQTCFCFCFDWSGSEWTKRQNIPEGELCFCLLFGIWNGTALRPANTRPHILLWGGYD